MDIAKILDFHRMVMLAAGEHDHLDETSCGPLCQHPACWVSNRRKERGAPRRRSLESEESEEESGELNRHTVCELMKQSKL